MTSGDRRCGCRCCALHRSRVYFYSWTWALQYKTGGKMLLPGSTRPILKRSNDLDCLRLFCLPRRRCGAQHFLHGNPGRCPRPRGCPTMQPWTSIGLASLIACLQRVQSAFAGRRAWSTCQASTARNSSASRVSEDGHGCPTSLQPPLG